MPSAAQNYLITELELYGLAINGASFFQLLKEVGFHMIVDHLALKYIMKIKTEPATSRTKRLLEVLHSHTFDLYYLKCKDMILSNFLS